MDGVAGTPGSRPSACTGRLAASRATPPVAAQIPLVLSGEQGGDELATAADWKSVSARALVVATILSHCRQAKEVDHVPPS
jgi:hypothetical protein